MRPASPARPPSPQFVHASTVTQAIVPGTKGNYRSHEPIMTSLSPVYSSRRLLRLPRQRLKKTHQNLVPYSILQRISGKYLVVLLQLLLYLPSTTALTCMTCVPTPDSTQLDRFRVTTRLNKAFCPMEPIECDRDQDVCVTITMHIGHGEYWLGAGCDRRNNFQHLSCQNVRTLARSVLQGHVHERRALQRVCVCSRDFCNSSWRGATPWLFILVLTVFWSFR